MTPLPDIDIAYAAHTASCTFLLDDEGICRRIVMAPKGKRRESSRTAANCVGAQYVASLDGSAAGGLVEMPRVGSAMLFARVDERGRVSLVRTGALTSFESRAGEDPFVPAPSVETSAPVLEDIAPRSERHALPPVRDDYFDPSERTQQIEALRQRYDEDPELAEDSYGPRPTGPELDLETAEYQSVAGPSSQRPTPRPTPRPPTLRRPPREATLEGNDSYARPAPPMPSRPPARRSDPDGIHSSSSAAHAWSPESSRQPPPPAFDSEVQVNRRRRDG